ncbi:MucB/RseB C-terminal domain-containing protein [Aquabacterium sp. OR-4]|uniref:MucB/RseB C-terminal domain-containing protein n=1 Tax=Aquabacterium sp. OR-4 TaxID=2978127 RepID=UPI0021B31281|nr:MucB/RseB C-terminal domain-containing protein [Aquabacterium sp. OR-4]MDT7834521.1 MucB/RseB C-terminal domain-containing protein [Aquabacterium sp. OR-4]
MTVRRLGAHGGVARQGLAAGLGLAVLCWPLLPVAQTAVSRVAPQSVPTATAIDEALQWLSRAQQAVAQRSYQGTLTFTAGGVVSSSRVLHVCDARQRVERIEVLDGKPRLQFRHNEQMLTLWPATRLAVAEQDDPVSEFPALPRMAGQRVLEQYELRAMGADRVAGHDAQVLMFKPRDEWRFAQRLWAERETGLLLRADLLGRNGEVLESTAFSDLRIGGRLSAEPVLAAMRKLEGYRVVQAPAVKTEPEVEGWRIARAVPGFQLVSCTRRSLDLAERETVEPVMQAVFSDGLAQVSVFIERFDAQRHRQPMRSLMGATQTLTSRRGDWWFTVVGEVPLATAQQFEMLFERRR